MEKCYPAMPEYATAKIAVWWDMNDCPIPEGYDVSRVRPNLEGAFKRLGYTGPVSITAYGDLKQTPDRVLRGLVYTGVTVAHSAPGHICSFMFSDILKWRAHNRPPATMMLISNRVEDVLSWDLSRLQQETYYNLFLAYSVKPISSGNLRISAEWFWDSLLKSPVNEKETPSALVTAMFYCKLCSLDCQTLKTLREHLSSRRHILKEDRHSADRELDPVTRLWGRNYPAKPEHATANIGVWWNMDHCPIPEGYDARQVRTSIEGEFRSLGYTGPVSIIAFADQKLTPYHVLEALSSTGIDVAHSIPEKTTGLLFNDMMEWQRANPPPATTMLISDRVDQLYSHALVKLQQRKKYNLFLAYSSRPYKMSVLVTSAEWLWNSLLGVSKTRAQLVDKCSGESVKSTGMFYCRLCHIDCKGLEHFREHLTSKVHTRIERGILEDIIYVEQHQELTREKKLLRKGQIFEESIIPDRVSRKRSSQTFATKEKKNNVATQKKKNSAAPPSFKMYQDPPETDSATESRALVVKGKGALQPSGPGASYSLPSSMGSSLNAAAPPFYPSGSSSNLA